MAEDIAVFVGETGFAASLYDVGKIIVFERRMKVWQPSRKLEFTLAHSASMPALRQKMQELLAFLGDCKIFVGQTVTGLPFFELEKGDIHVWEFTGSPLDFLDYVWEQELAAVAQVTQKEPLVPPEPVALGDGCFAISLTEIQRSDSTITSKQVLLPFLQKTPFYELAVTCRHVPPWLELELIGDVFAGKVEKLPDQQYLVKIKRKACQE
ncbi:MAG: Fe-only nitrogenase accessory AnfO family protein [Sporomusaceae bacterium]|nr:Fe-only nitrogenase accessory AnfO family protein [Sporomusaceae bacterium]